MSKFGLCVGLNYAGTQSALAGCLNDANDIEDALTQRGFAVTKLLERDATKSAILKHLTVLVESLRYGDLAVFSISSHGSWVPDESGDEPDGRDEVLIPWDIEEGNYITDDDLAKIFAERERGARVVMLSDSCHSGTVSRFSRELSPPANAAKVRFLPPAAFLPESEIMDVRGISGSTRRAAQPPGRTASLLLAGCGDLEFAYDAWFGDRANGAFTRAALDSLAELHTPGNYQDWMRKIRTKLPSASYPQTPAIYGPRYMAKHGILEEGR
jgi:hypothetical protein